jgi:hypothetical protein
MKSIRPAILAMAVFVFLQAGLAQKKYSGPRPPKPDVPFLLHADNLVPTEVLEANEEKRKNENCRLYPGRQFTREDPPGRADLPSRKR